MDVTATATATVTAAGAVEGRAVELVPQLLAGLVARPAEFRARWGRNMDVGDPLVPDWDAHEPAPMPAEKLTAVVRTLRSVLAEPLDAR